MKINVLVLTDVFCLCVITLRDGKLQLSTGWKIVITFNHQPLLNIGERTPDNYCKAEEVGDRAGVDVVACLSQGSTPATQSQRRASAD